MNSPTNLEGPLLMTKEGHSWSTRAIDAKNRADFISANNSREFVDQALPTAPSLASLVSLGALIQELPARGGVA